VSERRVCGRGHGCEASTREAHGHMPGSSGCPLPPRAYMRTICSRVMLSACTRAWYGTPALPPAAEPAHRGDSADSDEPARAPSPACSCSAFCSASDAAAAAAEPPCSRWCCARRAAAPGGSASPSRLPLLPLAGAVEGLGPRSGSWRGGRRAGGVGSGKRGHGSPRQHVPLVHAGVLCARAGRCVPAATTRALRRRAHAKVCPLS
jgi:hypothetical protein